MPYNARRFRRWSFCTQLEIPICFQLKPADSTQRTSSDTFFAEAAEFTFRSLLNLISSSPCFGGSLPDVRSVIGSADSLSFVADCYLLCAMRITQRQQYSQLPGLRQ